MGVALKDTTKRDTYNGLDSSGSDRRNAMDRRERHPLAARRHWIGGRRHGGRRRDDQPLYVDRYEPIVVYTAAAILILCCIDAAFTLVLLDKGATEANVFMRVMIEAGIGSFLGTKITATAISIVLLVMHKNFHFLRLVKVRSLVHYILVMYVVLVSYEIILLQIAYRG